MSRHSRSGLRLEKWRREDLEAGVITLAGVIIGGLALFYILYTGPLILAKDHNNKYIITDPSQFYRIINTTSSVAIMFSSDTCPVCRKMEPYWASLSDENNVGLKFYILKLNDDTIKIFIHLNVQDTPTFIVFVDGKPVARHVGAFSGPSIPNAMLEWARLSAGLLKGSDLQLFERYCGSCHSSPGSMESANMSAWIEEHSNDKLISLIAAAARNGTIPSQELGGFDALIDIVRSMNQSLDQYNSTRIALLIDAFAFSIADTETGRGVSKIAFRPDGSEEKYKMGKIILNTATALTAGIIASLSPCVFPVLLAYVSLLTQKGTRLGSLAALKAFASATAGTLTIGVLFVAIGVSVQSVSVILLPTAALTLLAAGILGYLGVPTFLSIGISTRRGIAGFSFIYGLLAVQCSLPLVVGSLMLVASGGLETGLITLAAFTLGISAPVGLAVWASERTRVYGILNKLTMEKYRKYSYLILGLMGLVLLLYSTQILRF